jgi:transmembrane sensor
MRQAMDRDVDGDLAGEAIDWLVRLRSGSATHADYLAFRRWRSQTIEHGRAAQEAEALWRDLGWTQVAQSFRTSGRHQSAGRGVSRRLVLAGLSAVSVSAAGVVIGAGEFGPVSRLFADYGTGIGERRDVSLPDGSTAHLNTESALSLSYTKAERRLSLTAGEGLFDVVKDDRPFIVAAGGGEVRATGTVFCVRCADDRVDVSVAEGAVQVTLKDGGAAERLSAGQGTSYDRSRFLVPVGAIDIDAVTAWRRGKLIFNRRRLDEVVAEIERYQVGRILVVGDELRAMPISGVFELDDAPGMMRTIASTLPVTVTELPLLTILRPSAAL